MEALPTKIGIGVMIFKEGRILLAKRKSNHGSGEYSFPGGHLEYMESFESCALREIAEECGVEVENLRFQVVANITEYAPKHYVLIGFIADWKSGEPQNLEPENFESWGWYNLDDLPTPLFVGSQLIVDSYKNNQTYFDLK